MWVRQRSSGERPERGAPANSRCQAGKVQRSVGWQEKLAISEVLMQLRPVPALLVVFPDPGAPRGTWHVLKQSFLNGWKGRDGWRHFTSLCGVWRCVSRVMRCLPTPRVHSCGAGSTGSPRVTTARLTAFPVYEWAPGAPHKDNLSLNNCINNAGTSFLHACKQTRMVL